MKTVKIQLIGGEGVEEQLRAGGRKAVDHRAEGENHHERQEHHDPLKRRGIERIAEVGQIFVGADLIHRRGIGHSKAGNGPRGQCGDDHPHRHGAVNLVHMGAKTCVDLGGANAGTRAGRLIVSHVFLQFGCVAAG